MKKLTLGIFLLALSSVAFAQATKPGTYYVKESVLEVHLAPSATGSVTPYLSTAKGRNP